ncbi:MAG: hypothetical protein ACLQGP_37860 [Isosphaeraceae bacterium]
MSDQEIIGLAPASRLDLLTWERVYELAVVRSRDGRSGLAEVLDPKALDEQTARLGVADFDRFRTDFLAARPGGGRSFRDPSGDYLDLLRRLEMIDNARRHIFYLENLSKLVSELIQGEAAGLTQLDVDLVRTALVRARQGLSREVRQFGDRLDEMKVALGLSPHAPVIPDRRRLAAFRTTFEAVDNWSRRPDRSLSELHKIAQKLPALGDLVIDGRPVLGTAEGKSAPNADLLANAVRVALENRVGPDKGQADGEIGAEIELGIRRGVRHLFETHHAYQEEKHAYELARRLADQSFERMVSPSAASVSGRSQLFAGVIEQFARIRDVEDRLVTLWTSFRAERLALYRELGVLPYLGWASFYKDLAAD